MNKMDKLIKLILENVPEDHAVAMFQDLASKAHEFRIVNTHKTVEDFERHVIQCDQCISNMVPLENFWALSHARPDVPCVTPGHSESRFSKN